MQKPVINREVAKRVLETVDQGLVKGLGVPEPGKMCVEAAVCYALGLPHSDDPKCVGAAVRTFKIALNDAAWSSNNTRAKGMRAVAIAQLGSNTIDQVEFAKEVALQTIKQVLPITLRGIGLEKEAKACEESMSLHAALYAAESALYAAESAAESALYAAQSAAESAKYAAESVLYAAWSAKYAAWSAKYAAQSAAESAKYAAPSKKDTILSLAAKIAVDALIKLGAQGTEWLDLCD